MCTILFKFGKDLNIDNWKLAKKIEIDEICFFNKFKHIWFKHAFGLENYGFQECDFNKILHFYVIKNMNT